MLRSLGYIAYRRTANLSDFILGGRSLGSWVTALAAQASDMSGWLLIPTSDTTFLSPQDYAQIEVIAAEDGSVERLDWTTAGNTYPMPRISGDSE